MQTSTSKTVTGPDSADVVNCLNSFFRQEIAAETAYGLAADRAKGGGPDALYLGLLRQFQEEHGLAAEAIRDQIRELGGETIDSSGNFGAWSSAAAPANGRRGDSLLHDLKRGEENNLNVYLEGMRSLDASSAQLVTNLLVPTQQRHLNVFDELLGKELNG